MQGPRGYCWTILTSLLVLWMTTVSGSDENGKAKQNHEQAVCRRYFNLQPGDTLEYRIFTGIRWVETNLNKQGSAPIILRWASQTERSVNPRSIPDPAGRSGLNKSNGIYVASPFSTDFRLIIEVNKSTEKSEGIMLKVTPIFSYIKYRDDTGKQWSIPVASDNAEEYLKSRLARLQFLIQYNKDRLPSHHQNDQAVNAATIRRQSLHDQMLSIVLAHLHNRSFQVCISREEVPPSFPEFSNTLKGIFEENYAPEIDVFLKEEIAKWTELIFPALSKDLRSRSRWEIGDVTYKVKGCRVDKDAGIIKSATISGRTNKDAVKAGFKFEQFACQSSKGFSDHIKMLDNKVRDRKITFKQKTILVRQEETSKSELEWWVHVKLKNR